MILEGGSEGGGISESNGGGGDGGKGGGWNCTTKDLVPWRRSLRAKRKLWPKPGAFHSAPFQPSPYESVMSRVHVAPSVTTNGKLEFTVYGAPPMRVMPSEQARLQPTSSGCDPSEQVIAEEIAGAAGGDGGEGGGGSEGGDGGGEGGDGGGEGGK